MRRRGSAKSQTPPQRQTNRIHYRRDTARMFPYLRRLWPLLIASALITVLCAVIALAEPWPFALLLDSALGKKPPAQFIAAIFGADRFHLVLVAAIGTLAISLVGSGAALIDNFIHITLEQRLTLEFRSDLFKHAQILSLEDQTSSGGMIARINLQAPAIGNIVTGIPPVVQSALILVGMFFIALQLDAEVTLLALIVVPFIYLSTGYYSRAIEPRLYRVRNLEGQALQLLHEAMSLRFLVTAFHRQDHEHRRFRAQGEQARDARIKLTVRQTMFSLAVGTITAVGSALVLGVGAYHVLTGRLSIGELVVLLAYIRQIYQPLEQMSGTFTAMQTEYVNLQGALDLLEIEPGVLDTPDAVPIESVRGKVGFENVDFSYLGRRPALKGISFQAQPGELVAIVGSTGAGKSTIVSMLARLFDPSSGRVLIDDRDIRGVTLESLRSNISIVLQEPLLFAATIAENIRYGRLDATMDEIVEAAKAANCHDFVMALPDEYKTLLGERGAKLSGGERQRICVARAFLKDAPILILDEPTSSIDSRTEAVILDALDRLMVGRTTFMIAHRLSTLRNPSHILVIDRGALIESGTREELLARNGYYSALHKMQFSWGATSETGAAVRLVGAVSGTNGTNATNGGSTNGQSNGHQNGTAAARPSWDQLQQSGMTLARAIAMHNDMVADEARAVAAAVASEDDPE